MGRRKTNKSSPSRRVGGDAVSTTMRSRDEGGGSIGSALSLKDQFDILVPIKIKDRPTVGGARGEEDESDISSVTTDEHKKMLKYLYHTRAQRLGLCTSAATGWCCFSEMSSSKNNNVSPHAVMGGKHKKKKNRGKNQSQNGTIGHPVSIDKTCDVSRSQYSLFDALSEDDDEDDTMVRSATTEDPGDHSMIKRKRSWRVSIRKKMPWSKQK